MRVVFAEFLKPLETYNKRVDAAESLVLAGRLFMQAWYNQDVLRRQHFSAATNRHSQEFTVVSLQG